MRRWCFIDWIKALPYIVGILTLIGGGIKWLYGQLEEERNHYFKLYEEKEKEAAELRDQLNKKDIEIMKLKLSQKKR